MIKRLINNKGAIPIGVIMVVVVVAVAAAVVVGFLTDGFGFGGGKGDSEGEGNVSSVQSEPEASEPIVEELDFLNVTVSENEYLYQNSKLKLDELMNKLVTDAANTKVKVTDENASKRAYENLIVALEDKNIRYIKADV